MHTSSPYNESAEHPEPCDPGKRGRILLLCGGQSPEHAVSLSSGRCCAHALDRTKWELHVGCIFLDGSWAFSPLCIDASVSVGEIDKLFDVLEMPDLAPTGYLNVVSTGMAIEYLMGENRPDLIVPVTHGLRGEDGTLQGLLDFLGIPYVGSGVLGSALAMDKVRASEYLEAHGIRTPRRVVIGGGRLAWHPETTAQLVADHLGWPVFVKPSRGGSSIATAMASNPVELAECIEQAAALDSMILVEERIQGMEITCGVLEIPGCGCFQAEGTALHRVICPPTEIRPRQGGFFDYASKYRLGGSEEITPARLEAETLRHVQEVADRAHVLLGCRGLSRTDMIVTAEGEPVFLETNTLPGMTPTSLLPQGARAIGLDMTGLLEALLEAALAAARKTPAPAHCKTVSE